MGHRRAARELALQALFYMDVRQCLNEAHLQRYLQSFPPPRAARDFLLQLTQGVMRSLKVLDATIEGYSDNWRMARMAAVDRNVLRIAVFEIFFAADIPATVTINEAIEVGKRFGTAESGSFINGILDGIRLAVENGRLAVPASVPPPPEETAAASPEEPAAERSAVVSDEMSRVQVTGGLMRRRPAAAGGAGHAEPSFKENDS